MIQYIVENGLGLGGLFFGLSSIVVALCLHKRAAKELVTVRDELSKNVSDHDKRLEALGEKLSRQGEDVTLLLQETSDGFRTVSSKIKPKNDGWRKQVTGRFHHEAERHYVVQVSSSKDGDRIIVHRVRAELGLTDAFVQWRERNIGDRNAIGPSVETCKRLEGEVIIEREVKVDDGSGIVLSPGDEPKRFSFDITEADLRSAIEQYVPGSTLGSHWSKNWLAGCVTLSLSCAGEEAEVQLALNARTSAT
jgi:hypothetical protein